MLLPDIGYLAGRISGATLPKTPVDLNLSFLMERLNWTWNDLDWLEPLPTLPWKKVIDWPRNKDDVEPIEKKIMVWVAMSSSCLEGLHIFSL